MAQSRGCLGRVLLLVAGTFLLVLAGVVLLAYLVGTAIAPVLTGPAPLPFDPLTGSVEVPTPAQMNSLAWSPDGQYLVGGTWGSPPPTAAGDSTGEVYVVSVGKAAVVATLKQKAWVRGVAFSPDGKWLAVATAHTVLAGEAAELVVYDVPAFAPQFRAKGGLLGGFVDLAWAADGRTLWALEGTDVPNQPAALRRWAVPGFDEQPAIQKPQMQKYEALAVAPDNRIVAVLDTTGVGARLVRLFDAATGEEWSSIRAGEPRGYPPRLGFTPDGKAVGVDDLNAGLTWWDAATGRKAEPKPARFAAPLSGLSQFPAQHALSPDGSRRAVGYRKQARVVFEGVGGPPNQFGLMVRMTASGRTWTWRFGDAYGLEPAVAFSPDGTRLAATTGNPSGGSVFLWTVPD